MFKLKTRSKEIVFSTWGKSLCISVYYPKPPKALYPDRLGMYWIVGWHSIQFTDQRKTMKDV